MQETKSIHERALGLVVSFSKACEIQGFVPAPINSYDTSRNRLNWRRVDRSETRLGVDSKKKYHFPGGMLKVESGSGYMEFIHNATLSAGIYALLAGGTDTQNPHTEDELYYVISGSSSMIVGEERFEVRAGDAIFVPAFLEHRFYDITDDLKLLVFFSKAPVEQ